MYGYFLEQHNDKKTTVEIKMERNWQDIWKHLQAIFIQ